MAGPVRVLAAGATIIPAAVVVLDASACASIAGAADLTAVHRHLLNDQDPTANHGPAAAALAAILNLAQTAERKRAAPKEICSADIPTAGARYPDGAQSTPMAHTSPTDLDVAATAAALGIGERAVRALAERGTLTARKIGGRWCFHPAAVQQLTDRRATRRRSAWQPPTTG